MSTKSEENREVEKEKEKEDTTLKGLPLKSKDYKRKGYGTEGHMEPKQGLGGGATDAPTPSGGDLATEEQIKAVDDAKSHGTNSDQNIK
ncbi:hypothetical protein AQUCO_00100198v1 [Aquilegia coerulea]|uniref:Uncharacterized protein n=1 Tax=Aquilegia coerulea TaxID=218851 RepID=A0A2G5F9D7_AQUCA|nr:hypothetical protein AQUCO_00100198v1 [Aquilegia coerulea]